ncbi:MAG: aldolase/citrate lyase family protein [Pseudomonadota bacterium]
MDGQATRLRERMRAGERLVGTFVKTPHPMIVEVLAHAPLDFICLDAEHAPFDRAAIDLCLAMARASGLAALVRVPEAQPAAVLSVLDAGADGLVVPHVTSAAMAEAVVRASRYGHGGRGFAGSTRSAGFATRPMATVLAETPAPLILAQIEEPEGVAAAAAIAAVDGFDALFVGPADLAVSLGETAIDASPVRAAIASVGEAARGAGKALVTFAPGPEMAPELAALGVTVFLLGSEHAWMLAGARAAVAGLRGPG